MNDDDLAFATIEELARLYRRRRVSPVETTKVMLARIERVNPKLNAYITVTAELALAQARAAEAELFAPRSRKGRRERGPLHGVPISLKDNIYTKGVRTTAGSKILKEFVPDQDAAVWSNLRQAGAILLGKTNLHEFAYGVTTNNPHYGPTRNPWDLDRIPGGSSGGSAAAVAAGLCYGSIGTDTGGSIRIPASLCGIVGLKPGSDRVSAAGVVPLSRTLDFVGPLARTVADAALLFSMLLDESKLAAHPKKSRRHQKFALGLPREFFFDVVSEDVDSSFREALRRCVRAGHKLKDVSIPSLSETEEAGNLIAWPEATQYHQQSGWFPSCAAQYGEDVRARLEAGTKVAATAYLEAIGTRERFIQQLEAVFAEAKIDALVVPTTPITAPRIGEESTEIARKQHPTRGLLLRLNRPANLSGSPAISLPCGTSRAGLPVGLQLIGRRGNEYSLLSLASLFEAKLGATGLPVAQVAGL